MTKIYLKRGEEKRIQMGHAWVFDNEVLQVEGEYEPADIVEVCMHNGNYLGKGYINPKSKILVRILTRGREEIDEAFFRRRIQEAWDYRKKICNTSSCRVIFGEADFLPGLTVDKFGDYLSLQTLALGIDKYKDIICDLLLEITGAKGIYERNDVALREKEGMEQIKGFLRGTFDTNVMIQENEIKMMVDMAEGQKTGYFLDQKENRAALKNLVKDATVLDTCCHTGGFSMHAAVYGAKEVTSVDISQHAIDYVMQNARLNGVEDKITGVVGNIFDLLKEYQAAGKKYDVVILDPPAFCKTKSALKGAIRGYKEINLRGMKLVKPGGFLITCSCSHYMTPHLFDEMLRDAARDARKILRQVEFRTQSKDHPILFGADESLYLKCSILQIM